MRLNIYLCARKRAGSCVKVPDDAHLYTHGSRTPLHTCTAQHTPYHHRSTRFAVCSLRTRSPMNEPLPRAYDSSAGLTTRMPLPSSIYNTTPRDALSQHDTLPSRAPATQQHHRTPGTWSPHTATCSTLPAAQTGPPPHTVTTHCNIAPHTTDAAHRITNTPPLHTWQLYTSSYHCKDIPRRLRVVIEMRLFQHHVFCCVVVELHPEQLCSPPPFSVFETLHYSIVHPTAMSFKLHTRHTPAK